MPRLPLVALSLAGLVLYDVGFVVGTQQLTDGGESIMEAVARAKMSLGPATNAAAATAATTTTAATAAAAAASSAASAAVASAPALFSWRPGLLEVSVGGRVSDVLGLGDVAFPAMLAGWARRYDTPTPAAPPLAGGETPPPPAPVPALAPVSAPVSAPLPVASAPARRVYPAALVGYGAGCLLCEVFQTGQGQPALLYVVPAMAAAVAAAGALGGGLGEMWGRDPAQGETQGEQGE